MKDRGFLMDKKFYRLTCWIFKHFFHKNDRFRFPTIYPHFINNAIISYDLL